MLGGLEAFDDDCNNIGETLDALSHAQAEIAEPLVVETNGPVLGQEFNNVGDYASVESACKRVEIVLVQANE